MIKLYATAALELSNAQTMHGASVRVLNLRPGYLQRYRIAARPDRALSAHDPTRLCGLKQAASNGDLGWRLMAEPPAPSA